MQCPCPARLEILPTTRADRCPFETRDHSAQQRRWLPRRERDILRLVAAGLTNREIGSEIGLAVGTVKNEVAKILSKLNVTDRTQAAVQAVVLGLVESTT